MKRLLNCTASEKLAMNGEELKQSIKACEGRVIMSENVIAVSPLLGDVSNPELAAAFGSDLCLLNVFDCNNPKIAGVVTDGNPVALLKKLIGRPVGCNLEPVDPDAKMMEERLRIPAGRMASAETFKKAQQLGFNFVCLTGNPGTGVTNESIARAIKNAKKYFSGLIIAGKMHSAGVDEPLVDLKAIGKFIEAGADVILLPAVNTVPSLSEEEMRAAMQGRFVYDMYEDFYFEGDTVTKTYYSISHYDREYAEQYGYEEYGDSVYEDTVVKWDYRRGVIKCKWMEDIIVKMVDLENEINADIDSLVDLKAEMVSVIKNVRNPELQTLLELRYLCFKTWEQIAVELGYSIESIYRLHREALKNIKMPRKLNSK